MKKITITLILCLATIAAQAQERKIVEQLRIDTRGDYQFTTIDGNTIDGMSGFEGRNLNVLVSGTLADRFTYFCRQRLNKSSLDAGFFNATDRLYLDYHATDRLTLRAGKQTIAIGGYEYDRSSIDLYTYSEYLNQVSCYAWGAAVLYEPKPSDQLIFQVSQSMFDALYDQPNTYSWNLMWYGSHGFWDTTWSANLTEWKKNHFISYLCFGNKFRIADCLNLEVDVMNRAAAHQAFLFRDCSLIGQLNFQPISQVNLFTKVSYDVNKTNVNADQLVTPGTEITCVGAGCEYFPLNDNRIRLHATCSYAFGKNTNPVGILDDRMTIADVGLTWRVNIIKPQQP